MLYLTGKTMSIISTYLVGRSGDCDLVLSHPSVSRVHLEVVCLARDFYLTDRASSGGTFVWQDHSWVRIKQSQVAASTRLCLGEYEMSATDLAVLKRPSEGNLNAQRPKEGLDADAGLRRDPASGEILEG